MLQNILIKYVAMFFFYDNKCYIYTNKYQYVINYYNKVVY